MKPLAAAMKYLRFGFSPIPVNAEEKKGSFIKWTPFQDKPPDAGQVQSWWDRWPNADIAIVTGQVSGLVVLDLDRKENDDGEQIVRSLYGDSIDDAPFVITGSGGKHCYFRHPGGGKIKNRTALLPAVDLRADGGFVYAPPSKHPSGNRYEWGTPPWEVEPPMLPEWLVDLIEERDRAEVTDGAARSLTDWDEILTQGVPEGERNDTATRICGYLLNLGLTPTMVMLMMRQWNQNNSPPLPDKELQSVVKSITKKELMKSGGLSGKTGDSGAEEAPHSGSNGGDGGLEGDRDLALQAVSERFGVKIGDIVRIGGSSPTYRFHCNGDYAEVSARDIGSQWAWRRAIISVTEQVPAKIGKKSDKPYEHFLQLMLNAARHVEPGEEATYRGQLKQWVSSYLGAHEPTPEDDESLRAGEPRWHDGQPWIHVATMRKFIKSEYDVKVDNKKLVQQIKSEGFQRKTLYIKMARQEGVTRSMWSVPEEFQPDGLTPPGEDQS